MCLGMLNEQQETECLENHSQRANLLGFCFPDPVSTFTGITTVQVIKCVGGCTKAVSSNISLSSANS